MQGELTPEADDTRTPRIGGVALAEIADCNGFRLRRAARMMTAIFDERLGEAGLTSQQFALLATIYGAMANGRILSMTTLAELSGLDPTTLTRTLLPLKSAGWVTDRRADEDRRRRRVELTASGEARLIEGVRQWRAASQTVELRLGQTLNAEIRTSLNTALGRLAAD